MNEYYVSLEAAKLLKKKGFDFTVCKGFVKYSENEMRETTYYQRPTLYIAHKWLRETKDIHIMIDVCASGYFSTLFKTNGTFIKTLVEKGPNDGGVWDSYEEAFQAGILEALKFI